MRLEVLNHADPFKKCVPCACELRVADGQGNNFTGSWTRSQRHAFSILLHGQPDSIMEPRIKCVLFPLSSTLNNLSFIHCAQDALCP